ncbi:MAG: biotin synthase BioB [bacterium]|nr:biotin synthase BioB [bacterium]
MINQVLLETSKGLLNNEPITFSKAIYFSRLEGTDILDLISLANRVRKEYAGEKIDLCAIINAKSGACAEDCHFCGQSAHYKTNLATYPLKSEDEILTSAKEAEISGATRFCIVISGKKPETKDLKKIVATLVKLRQETSLKLDCSLGTLNEDEIYELKNAGVTRYNHNLETSEGYFKQICTTHSYEDRLNTVKILKKIGLEVCCGGIIGLGEDWDERIRLAFALKDLNVNCIPINILNPRPGTPLENVKPLSPMEIIKTIAVFRLILKDKIIKIAGGREVNLRDLQSLALLAGANGLIIGNYLTTEGRTASLDLQMLKDLEMESGRWKPELVREKYPQTR